MRRLRRVWRHWRRSVGRFLSDRDALDVVLLYQQLVQGAANHGFDKQNTAHERHGRDVLPATDCRVVAAQLEKGVQHVRQGRNVHPHSHVAQRLVVHFLHVHQEDVPIQLRNLPVLRNNLRTVPFFQVRVPRVDGLDAALIHGLCITVHLGTERLCTVQNAKHKRVQDFLQNNAKADAQIIAKNPNLHGGHSGQERRRVGGHVFRFDAYRQFF